MCKVKDLQEHLKNFKPDADVVLFQWNDPNSGDNEFDVNIGVNFEHQLKNQKVQLCRGFQVE